MTKRVIEFQCNGGEKDMQPNMSQNPDSSCNCGWYNYPQFDDTMNGNYTIVCGHCGHQHYRVIKNGVVTEDRHSETYGTPIVIRVLNSQTQPEKRKLGLIAQFNQMIAAGRAT